MLPRFHGGYNSPSRTFGAAEASALVAGTVVGGIVGEVYLGLCFEGRRLRLLAKF